MIRGNVSYDNMDVVVVDAISHSGGRTTDGNGVILDDFEHTQGAGGAPYRYPSLVVGNTVFDNGGRGVQVFQSRNVAVVGNTAWHDLKDANLQRPAAEISAAFAAGVTVMDNIAAPRPGEIALMDSYAQGADAWDFNMATGTQPWRAVKSQARHGPHLKVVADPGFVHASADPASADFHLRPDSTARHAGAAVRLGVGVAKTLPGSPSDLGFEAKVAP